MFLFLSRTNVYSDVKNLYNNLLYINCYVFQLQLSRGKKRKIIFRKYQKLRPTKKKKTVHVIRNYTFQLKKYIHFSLKIFRQQKFYSVCLIIKNICNVLN